MKTKAKQRGIVLIVVLIMLAITKEADLKNSIGKLRNRQQ